MYSINISNCGNNHLTIQISSYFFFSIVFKCWQICMKLGTALCPLVEFSFFNQYIFCIVLCRYQERYREGLSLKICEGGGTRPPGEGDHLQSHVWEISFFSKLACFPNLSKTPSSNFFSDSKKLGEIKYVPSHLWRLNWIWETLSCDIIHLMQQDWAWSEPPERAFRIGSPLCPFGGDVIVSLSLGGCQESW